MSPAAARVTTLPVSPRCRLCTCKLDPAERDDLERAICWECKQRPEARRLGVKPNATSAARAFTEAERSLIGKLHGFMPTQQLLALLNERLHCDLGPDAAGYTIEQLHAQIQTIATPAASGDWASLRKLLAHARRTGVLAPINRQTIDDFAVVYALSPAQLLRLQDVVLSAKESGEAP